MKLFVHNLLVNTFLIILVINPIDGKTQNIDYNLYSAKKLLKFAQTAEQRGDYYTAIDCYEIYLDKKGKDYEAWYRLAENYRYARDYVQAEGAYKEVVDHMQNPARESFFYYAEMLMQQGKYKEALEAFNLANKKRQQGVERYLTKNRIAACEIILNGSVETKKIRLVHLNNSVNKVNTELSPMFLDNNTLLYSSIKADTIEFTETSDAAATTNVARFYTAKRDGDTVFHDNGPWNNFNNDNYFTGNGAISADKKRFYFTYCHRSALNKAICELYVSENKNGRWSEPKRLNDGINARGYTSTQVTVGYDSKYKREVIYFVSDRPGSRGGMDLWYSVFNHKTGKYSSAKNLGSKINTKADEITPFYDKSTSRLYFSSNYYPGYGGFDVFKSSGELRKWSQPVNLGKTVNSPADELYYTLNPQRKKEGFFASNRWGGYSAMHETCCDDIYYFQTEDIGNLFVKGNVEIAEIEMDTVIQYDIISYIVEESKHEEIIVDSSMLSRIKNMKVAYADNSADGLRGAIISVYQLEKDKSGIIHEIYLFSDTTDAQGRYLLELEPFYNYKISYKRDEFFNQNINISTVSPGWNDTIYMDPIGLKPIPKDPMQFNVFYALNSDKMKLESQERIDSTLLVILQESPDLIVEISSYTDNTGSTKYNKSLSQKRAESVVEYLEEKGIDSGRLIAVGYGEENPIASNNSEAGRAKNRRTEIRVVGSLDQFSKTNVGEFKVIKGTSSR